MPRGASPQSGELTIKTIRPHAGQQLVLSQAKRFNVLSCGRRFGKTAILIDRAIRGAIAGHPVAWVAPEYGLLDEPMREIMDRLAPAILTSNMRERRIELVGGGTIDFFSLDNPKGIRGRKFYRLLIDEAAHAKDLLRTWNFVLRPTLADLRGEAWFGSTPAGMNDFHEFYRRGQDGTAQWASWIMPTDANPYIHPEEIAEMRFSMGEIASSQEIDAEFVDMTGMVFRNIRICCRSTRIDGPEEGGIYACGIDLASTTDFTAIKILDISGTHPREVYSERWTRVVDWELQLSRLRTVLERFTPVLTVVDRTSHGDKPFQDLVRSMGGLPMKGVSFTHATKSAFVQSLALAFEKGAISIMDDPATIGELVSYEAKKTATGMITYGAPGNNHDDLVSALYLAYHAAGGSQSTHVGMGPKEITERANLPSVMRDRLKRSSRHGKRSKNGGWGKIPDITL